MLKFPIGWANNCDERTIKTRKTRMKLKPGLCMESPSRTELNTIPAVKLDGIEDDDIGGSALRQNTSFFQSNSGCGKAGHLADRALERQHFLFTNVLPEHARKGAGAARTLNSEPAVARDHDPCML